MPPAPPHLREEDTGGGGDATLWVGRAGGGGEPGRSLGRVRPGRPSIVIHSYYILYLFFTSCEFFLFSFFSRTWLNDLACIFHKEEKKQHTTKFQLQEQQPRSARGIPGVVRVTKTNTDRKQETQLIRWQRDWQGCVTPVAGAATMRALSSPPRSSNCLLPRRLAAANHEAAEMRCRTPSS